MNVTNITEASARAIAAGVSSGTLKAEDVTRAFADRVDLLRDKLNTHLYWQRSSVEAAAKAVGGNADLKRGSLAGVPIVIKDNICSSGEPVSCGSKILEGYVAPYDATVIARLKAAGAVIFGKANCDEFAMGSSNENSAFGPVKNPWDLSRVPGGSSGGSAAAVAAGMSPVSLGSDTGGSIRQPASLCGIVGLKPTYGRVSRFGLVAYGSSLDQIGPFARTVEDAALVFDAISGHDPKDSTSLTGGPATSHSHIQELAKSKSTLKGKRIGLVKEFMGEGMDPAVRKAIEQAMADFKELGAEFVSVSLPHLEYSLATYYILATAEASANLSRFDGVRYGHRSKNTDGTLKDMYQRTRTEGFGREVKQRIMLGTFVLSSGYYDAYFNKANRARKLITEDFTKAFASVDFLISPTSPTTAFKIGEKADDPIAMYLSDICTIAINLAGIPGVSVPAGYDASGLPIGLQLIGPRMADEALLGHAYIYEQKTKWGSRGQPKLS